MRANEKDRRMTELADHYQNQIKAALDNKTGIVMKLRRRIRQGNMSAADTWSDDYEM
jgi:hypothetical protein